MFGKIFLLLFWSISSQAQSFSTTIDGCEAKDMTKTINSDPKFRKGQGQWKGPMKTIGNWGFQASMVFDCNGNSCKVLGYHDVYRDSVKLELFDKTSDGVFKIDPLTRKTVGDRIVLSLDPNNGGITRHLLGDNARNLSLAISQDNRHFINDLGQDTLVFMNYANIGSIDIRIRTQITCANEHCVIEDDFLSYIAYNEVNMCEEEGELLY